MSPEDAVSPFALRGLKGLWWEPEQYLGWPAFLAGACYDLFMLCYTFCPETGLRWRQPFQSAELEISSSGWRASAGCTESSSAWRSTR